MSSWTEPKVNWTALDSFNIGDFNRIKNNLDFLGDVSRAMGKGLPLHDLGDDLTSYAVRWDVNDFNWIEWNTKYIAEAFLDDEYIVKRFFENGQFITWHELNRIESVCARVYPLIEGWLAGQTTIPFDLDSPRDIKV